MGGGHMHPPGTNSGSEITVALSSAPRCPSPGLPTPGIVPGARGEVESTAAGLCS